MNKHSFWGILAVLALTAGCTDDSAPSNLVKTPCDKDGETVCSQTGEQLVCVDGFYETQECAKGLKCKDGLCAEFCVPEAFPVACANETGIRRCAEDGFVTVEPCDVGNICHEGMCIDESRTQCDNSYPLQCRDAHSWTQCKKGWVVSHTCGENEICDNRMCIKATTCDSSFVNKCADRDNLLICRDGFQVTQKCPEGKICHDGACTDECEEGFAVCSNSGLSRFYCKDGKITEAPCTGGSVCSDGVCDTSNACKPQEYSPVCVDGKLQRCGDDGQLILESCTGFMECYNGSCVSDAPCNVNQFTPICINNSTYQSCVDGFKSVQNCNAGETCHDGICQKLNQQCSADDKPKCQSAEILQTCQDGVWHQSYCDRYAQVCSAGACIDSLKAISCLESAYVPQCEGNTVLTCEFGYVAKRECDANQHCNAGICYDNIAEGNACHEDTFVQQCLDDASTALCINGIITKVSCGDKRCSAGACVDKSCDPKTFTPECRGNFEVLSCDKNTVTTKSCGANTHCENGACVADANPGDPCTPTTYKANCNSEGKLLTCTTDSSGVSKITIVECPAEKSVCLNGACAACDPSSYKAMCTPSEAANVGPLKSSCNPDGTLKQELCPLDTVCFGAECAACNPATSKPSCKDNKTAQICKADGTFETKACSGAEQCIEGTGCTKACDSSGKCAADHYVCVNKVCIFQPECTVSATPVCHDTKSYKICEAPGIYSKPTSCQSNEKCENGVCVGNECDSSTFGTQCTNKTPTTCVNGYLHKGTECSGATPYCVDGVCTACEYNKTAVTCAGNTATICLPGNTLKEQTCDKNEVCKPGIGCESKCAGFTKDYCDSNGNRVYCADNGSTAVETCDFTETCVEGACKDRTGTKCNREVYNNVCHSTPEGSVLEYCHADPALGVQFKTCSISKESDNFCGVIDGNTDCFKRCTSPDAMICSNFSQDMLDGISLGVCTVGTDAASNQAYGYLPRLGICNTFGDSHILLSQSCYIDGMYLLSKFFICESMGRGTCDPNTGACTGAVECTPSDTTCDGLVAKSCEYDPALKKNVLVTIDCSTLGDKKCITYTAKGEKHATCQGTETYDMGSPAYSVSTTGTCNADGKNPNALHTMYYLASNHFGFSSMTCPLGCETKTEDGVTFSYCK